MSAMTLCHGTAARHTPNILSKGIMPRGTDAGVWDRCPSHPDRVYLSRCYAFYFAHSAMSEAGLEDVVLFEVDVPLSELYPDEDFMGQATMHDPTWKDMEPDLIKRTLIFRDTLGNGCLYPPAERQRLALESYNRFGCVSHGGVIKPEQIKRYVTVPKDEVVKLILMEHDPTISVLNYMVMGESHTKFQASLFERYPVTDISVANT